MRHKDPDTSFKCPPHNLPKQYILVIPRDGEKARTLLNQNRLVQFLLDSFDIEILVPNLNHMCTLEDNIRFFRNARGFISTHGAAFTNMQFIEKPGIVIQLVPNSINPFHAAANSYAILAKRQGHQSYIIAADSTKEPRWDMIFKPDHMLRIMCDKSQPNGVSKKFLSWHPAEGLVEKCADLFNKNSNHNSSSSVSQHARLSPEKKFPSKVTTKSTSKSSKSKAH